MEVQKSLPVDRCRENISKIDISRAFPVVKVKECVGMRDKIVINLDRWRRIFRNKNRE
jgi:hypothetical protein